MAIKNECIFCKFANNIIKQDFIYENDNFVAFADANPKVKGHTLVVPKKHYINSMDLPDSLGIELLDAIKNVADYHFKDKSVEGFNIVQNNFEAGGQVVMHIHFHFLPRKKSDGLKFGV